MKPRANKRKIRHARVRAKIRGTLERPRLSIYRSLGHVYAQLIDDIKGVTLVSVDDRKIDGKKKVERAQIAGKQLAELARGKGIEQVVFDRAGYIYTGRVRALAEGAREGGLQF